MDSQEAGGQAEGQAPVRAGDYGRDREELAGASLAAMKLIR